MEKKLYRNEHDKIVAGVASGLADYLSLDVLLVRILFVLSVPFLAGSGLLAYIIIWIVAPSKNDPSARYSKFNDYFQNQNNDMYNSANAYSNPTQKEQNKWNTPNAGPNFTMPNMDDFKTKTPGNDTGKTVVGLILLLLGIYFLLKQFIYIPIWFSIYKLWPLVIVALGIALIFKNKQRNDWEQFKKDTEQSSKQEGAKSTSTDANVVDVSSDDLSNDQQVK